jgi:hypothetical protein
LESLIETSVEPRKEWVVPELKKVDIEEITLFNPLEPKSGFSTNS